VCAVQELQPGDPQQIGSYRIAGRLGSGGMGKVYLGRSPGGRLVAVKVIREELTADAEFRTRFRREVTAARSVSGIFTAPVVDADTDGRLLWLATAYVDGPSLEAAIGQHGPFPAASVLALAAGLAEGLAGIHAVGVVHRDLKPANILLAGDGPRIIDFGISLAGGTSSLTGTGFAFGSPGYLSPEQAQGGRVGPASDVFSLGAVLAFAATGTGPFGTGATPALMYRVVHGVADVTRLPWELRPLVERCLAKDPARRPGTRDILAMLNSAGGAPGWQPTPAPVPASFSQRPLEQGPFGLPGAGQGQPPPPGQGLFETQHVTPVPRRAPERRSRPLIIGIAAGAVVVVAAAAFAAVQLMPSGHDSAAAKPPARTTPSATVTADDAQYTLRGNPCNLVKPATLKKYFPGIDGTSDNTYSDQDDCQWNTQSDKSLSIDVELYNVFAAKSANEQDAQENYQACIQALDKSGDGTKITGTQRVPGVGAAATAIFENDSNVGAQVSMCVWSGDVQLQNIVEDSTPPTGTAAVRKLKATQLAASIAVARNILADLPKASGT
jgi:serine/threonine protein kinase